MIAPSKHTRDAISDLKACLYRDYCKLTTRLGVLIAATSNHQSWNHDRSSDDLFLTYAQPAEWDDEWSAF